LDELANQVNSWLKTAVDAVWMISFLE